MQACDGFPYTTLSFFPGLVIFAMCRRIHVRLAEPVDVHSSHRQLYRVCASARSSPRKDLAVRHDLIPQSTTAALTVENRYSDIVKDETARSTLVSPPVALTWIIRCETFEQTVDMKDVSNAKEV